MGVVTMLRATIYFVWIILFTFAYSILADAICYFNTPGYHKLRHFYAHMVIAMFKLIGIRIHLDNEINTQRMLWVANHRSKFDGLMLQTLLCCGRGDALSVVKHTVGLIPIFAQFGRHTDTIFIRRSKDLAERVLTKMSQKAARMGWSILLFPEGTAISVDKKEKSDIYAKKINVEPYRNLMLPRKSGFNIIQKNGGFNKIGCMTIRYANPELVGNNDHDYPHFFSILPRDVYINVEYFDYREDVLDDIYKSMDEILDHPLKKKDYPINYTYSKIAVLFNLVYGTFFYYMLFTNYYFRWIVFYCTCITTACVYLNEWLYGRCY